MIDTSNEYWVEDRSSRVSKLGLSAGSVRRVEDRGRRGSELGLSVGSVGSGGRRGQ